MEEWKEYNIGNLCSKVCSGGTPSSKHSEYYDGNIPWLNTKEINFNRIYSTEKCITEEGLNKSSAKWIKEDSVIVAMYGATAGKTAIAKIPLTTNQACCNLMINPSIADYNFVYYYLCNKFTELASLANGGAQQNLNAQIIKEFPIFLPSLNEQHIIASILSSLDDKIENNRRINENLEQQAQALFKSWFVDFEPFKNGEFVESELGMIPKSWRVASLAELMDYSGGSQPPASEFIDEEREGYVRFVQIRDYASDSHITYIPISKKNKLCDVKDIMIARYGASLGRICYGLRGAYNVALAKVYPTKSYYLELLRCYLNTRDFYEGINRKGNRAVQAGFNKSDIQSFLLPIPCDEGIIIQFNELCSSMFDSRLSNDIESRRLAELRDTLLPRLMSGELKVDELAA
jgi:type I restriction enzyme S subunit